MKTTIMILSMCLGVSFQAMATDLLFPDANAKAEKYEAYRAKDHKPKGEITITAGNNISYHDYDHNLVISGQYHLNGGKLTAHLVDVGNKSSLMDHADLTIDLNGVETEEVFTPTGVIVVMHTEVDKGSWTGTTKNDPVIFKHTVTVED